jgi:hypothetical protein
MWLQSARGFSIVPRRAVPGCVRAAVGCAVVASAVVACAQGERVVDTTGNVEPMIVDGGQTMPSPTSSTPEPQGTGAAGTATGGVPNTATGGSPMIGAGGAPSSTSGGTSAGGTSSIDGGGAGTSSPTPEEQCLLLEAQTDCTRCACAWCTTLVLDCFVSGDAARDTACRTIVDCARANSCSNTDCYCGDPPISDTCATMAQGPCVAEIQDAAGTTDIGLIAGYQQDPNHAIGRASLLGGCAATNCAAECGL